jgi:hypothetical protein
MATEAQKKARERENQKTLVHLAKQGNDKAKAAITKKGSK